MDKNMNGLQSYTITRLSGYIEEKVPSFVAVYNQAPENGRPDPRNSSQLRIRQTGQPSPGSVNAFTGQ